MKLESTNAHLLFATTRIEVTKSDGSTATGTGFICNYVGKDDSNYLFIVTNKHVIADSTKGKMFFTRADSDNPETHNPILGKPIVIEPANFAAEWFYHVDDRIDIAVFPFGPILQESYAQGRDWIFYKAIRLEWIPNETQLNEIDPISDVIFIGYPNGIYDKKNLLPIVRKGITATPFEVDFEGLPVFLIDASVFPGSSGSPVFIRDDVLRYDNDGSFKLDGRIFLLGIVAEVCLRIDQNQIKWVNIPTAQVPIVETRQMIDLGIVYKSVEIKRAIEDFIASLPPEGTP